MVDNESESLFKIAALKYEFQSKAKLSDISKQNMYTFTHFHIR